MKIVDLPKFRPNPIKRKTQAKFGVRVESKINTEYIGSTLIIDDLELNQIKIKPITRIQKKTPENAEIRDHFNDSHYEEEDMGNEYGELQDENEYPEERNIDVEYADDNDFHDIDNYFDEYFEYEESSDSDYSF
ncbi:hypothetical protein GPJ56_005440 [Histomonas meleagridis]|uniref:uncharacterized protein n=1 Tax=Histomonas meleagridis TaxID=135588 RepID=UPI00355A922B|nr:hypothetical protein GPJ56_005440 [Histomonas meleagridis]KAH0802464.1 hypothetical protein GO595_004513 [Histomonas meleagridis]